jgi:hypothetical protein
MSLDLDDAGLVLGEVVGKPLMEAPSHSRPAPVDWALASALRTRATTKDRTAVAKKAIPRRGSLTVSVFSFFGTS